MLATCRSRAGVLAVVTVCLLLAPLAAQAAVYPTNLCVSKKMKHAGKYCAAALRAWGAWDRNQDTILRDERLATAATKLDDKWIAADLQAANKQVACTETTLAGPAMRALVDAALAPVITSINTGLDLGNPGNAGCGAALLRAAATKCLKFLKAESKFVKRLDLDPQATLRDQRQTLASQMFSTAWANATSGSCPTSATEGGVESAIDDLSDSVVFNTTVAPSVDDAAFEEFPAGPVNYDGRVFDPICSRNTPYRFWAKRGTVNKLVMYYQGGGACWDYFTCQQIVTFDEDVSAGDDPDGDTTGFADGTNLLNPFKDWNIVFVPYCSGDVHLGDNEATYTDGPNSVTIQHRGFVNAKVVEKWAREHFVNPDQIFVTGSSAGAYGALLHGVWLHRIYLASDINVLGDAGNGVITEDFRTDSFPNWNVDANLPPDVPGLVELTVPATTALAANFYPQSKWAHYSSAFDGDLFGQTGFYNTMLNPGNVGAWLSWWNASCEWNSLMRTQAIDTHNDAPANYRYYIGTGSRHTAWGSNKVYTDTTGGVSTLVDWVNAMITDSPAWTNVEATNSGLLLSGDPRPSPLEPPFQQVGPDVVITCP